VLAARQAIEGALPRERLFDFSPLYLFFHILVQKSLKQPGVFLKPAQVVWASLSASLLFLILKKLVRLPVALIRRAALILNPTLLVITQAYEPEALALFLLLWFLYLALRDDWPSHLQSGSLAGLAFLTRPNVLPVLPFVPVYFLVKPSRSQRKRLVSVLCFSLPVLLSLFLLLIRSERVAGRATLLRMNPGTVFYEGNDPLSWGTSSVYPYLVYDLARQYRQTPDVQHELYRQLARLSTGKDLTVSEVKSYRMGKAVRFIRVAKGLPDYRPAQIHLAAPKGLAGEEEAAASFYLDGVGARPDPVLLEKPLLQIFKARSEKSPADVRSLLEYGVVLRQFGHTQEALAVLNRADDLGSTQWSDRVRQEIQTAERIIEAHR